VGPQFGLAHMDLYRLFVYSDDGRLLGPAMIVDADNDAEAIAQAEAMRGPFAAELLDVGGLRIVKYLPGNGDDRGDQVGGG
jgi:hypothetical protein